MSILATTDGDDERRLRNAGPPAFGNVVALHEAGLRRLIAGRMADKDLVDDALQETYLRVFRTCRAGGRASPDGRWLRTVARRASIDLYRGEPPPAVDLNTLLMAVAGDALLPGSDEHLDNVDNRMALRWALARLSARQRRLLAWRVVHDLSYQDIAVIEKMSIGAVTSALARAKARLRVHLHAYEQRRAMPAVGLWIAYAWRRLRWRMQELAPRFAELAGATLAVGVVTAMVVPVHSPAYEDPAAVAGLSASTTDVVGLAEMQATLSMRGVAAIEASRPAPATPSMPRTPGSDRPLVAARPDVRIDPDESVVRYTIEVNGPTDTDISVEFEFYCTNGKVARTACPVLAGVPGSS